MIPKMSKKMVTFLEELMYFSVNELTENKTSECRIKYTINNKRKMLNKTVALL